MQLYFLHQHDTCLPNTRAYSQHSMLGKACVLWLCPCTNTGMQWSPQVLIRTFALLRTPWCFAIHEHDNSMTQHGLASFVSKFERQSFLLLGKSQGSLLSKKAAGAVSGCTGVHVKGRAKLQLRCLSWSVSCCVVHMQFTALNTKACCLDRISLCHRKPCSGGKLLDFIMQPLLFYAFCFPEKSAYCK